MPKDKQTHSRDLPLPFTIDAVVQGKYYSGAQYLGHGQSKVCYSLTDAVVLKLCEESDQEPKLFQEHQESGVYPVVHASGQCRVEDHEGPRLETWHAWVVDKAKPLDQILKENLHASNVCIPGAIRSMLTAYFMKHILSDNALFNFGMVKGKVVIIDAGSRCNQPLISKGEFNRKVMRRFWAKAQTVVHPDMLTVYKQMWQAEQRMDTALKIFETEWQKVFNNERTASVLNSLEGRTPTASACPHVASVMDSLDTETLDWITREYLWDKLANYGRSDDGYTRRQDRVYTAAEKLEHLISETQARRKIHCNNPAQDILDENELKDILDAWKHDYRQWMRPEILKGTWHMTRQEWHQFSRTAFRAHLFHIVGSYEMAIFFIVAPFNNENLETFKFFYGNLEQCKYYVRRRGKKRRANIITLAR